MMRPLKLRDGLILLLLLALLAAGGWIWSRPAGLAQVPDVALTTLDGQELRFTALRGQPLLVTFWATTCPSCVKEMPHLVELYHELAPRGLQMVGVAMNYDVPEDIRTLARLRQLPYIIGHDADGSVGRAFGNVILTPTTFLVAADGRIVYQRVGEADISLLRTTLLGLLGERAPGVA